MECSAGHCGFLAARSVFVERTPPRALQRLIFPGPVSNMVRNMAEQDVHKLMEILSYTFRDPELLLESLTHSSWSNEHPEDTCNERMEFIGDAVLGFTMAHEFFMRFPDWDEGMLTAAKAQVVGRDNLQETARRIDLFSFLRVGTGERRSRGNYPPSMGVDALEAVIGAVFLDGGSQPARQVILQLMAGVMEDLEKDGIQEDPKSRLQALSLQYFGKLPVYIIERQAGPEHEKKYIFRVTILDGRSATGEGSSKKEAQKNAARNLIELLQ